VQRNTEKHFSQLASFCSVLAHVHGQKTDSEHVWLPLQAEDVSYGLVGVAVDGVVRGTDDNACAAERDQLHESVSGGAVGRGSREVRSRRVRPNRGSAHFLWSRSPPARPSSSRICWISPSPSTCKPWARQESVTLQLIGR